ncbi:MAG: MFS transporter, partial [Proteobacteria bacterium]|nr:MFS transporter [Pseudomonadota bacterium]
SGYIFMGVSFGLLFALPFLAVFFSTSERKEFQRKAEPLDLRKLFLSPFKTPTFLNVLFMYLFAFVAMDVVMAIVIYFMTYYLERGQETNYVLGVLLLCQIAALPIFNQISQKTDKRTAYIAASGFLLTIMLFSFFIQPDMPGAIVYIFGGLVGIGSGGVVIMIYSIFPDMPDIDELYTGERREGLYSGLFTFMRKASSAIAIAAISSCISLAGYVPPVEKTVDGVTQMIKQAQTPEFFLVLRIVFAILPVVLLVVCLFNAVRYRLTGSVHLELKSLLDRQREPGGDQAPKKMEQKLKSILEKK